MSTDQFPLSPELVAQASEILGDVVEKTPVMYSQRLSDFVGVPVHLKREDMQTCRSFKVRGAYFRMSMLSEEERRRGVVCASAGNHAQGLAYACSQLKVRGTIYLPSNTPKQKRQRIETIGGDWVEQVIVDGTFDRANAQAQEAARHSGRTYIHPYDDPYTIAGQGTIAVELEEQILPEAAAVLVPVGGGGLLAGIATWVRSRFPGVKIYGVEPKGAASMRSRNPVMSSRSARSIPTKAGPESRLFFFVYSK